VTEGLKDYLLDGDGEGDGATWYRRREATVDSTSVKA